MLKTDFTFRKFLDTFVPGFILVVSIWYLYRPVINRYFPTIAFDAGGVNNDTFSNELKLVVLIVMSIFLGILVNHFSDIPVSLLYPSHNREKRSRAFKKTSIRLFVLISFRRKDDPRVNSIHRYVNSPRKKEFSKMLKEWGYSSVDHVLENREEAVIAHQHICSRIRVLNPFAERLFNNCISEVYFSAAILMSLIILFILSVLLIIPLLLDHFISNVSFKLNFIDPIMLVAILVVEYFLMVIITHSLRRRFRHFSSQILTIAFHFFGLNNKSKKPRSL